MTVWSLCVIYALRESNDIDSPLSGMNHERSAYYSLLCGLNASGLNTRFCCLIYVYVGVNSFTSPPCTAFSYRHYRGYFIALHLQLRTLLGCPPRRTGSDVTLISITIFGFEMQLIVSSRKLPYRHIARCRESVALSR